MYDRQRYLHCCDAINRLIADGYNITFPQTQYAVACNYDVVAFSDVCTYKKAI